jgi:DNA repair protein RadA/Sms
MGVDGLRELATPVATNRSRSEDVPGVVVTVTTDGSRSMLVEVQALVASSVGAPRRVAHRVSAQRLSLMLAVLESRCNTNVAAHDVFAATAGGLPAAEPANDLALALAIASAAQGFAVAATVAAVGEVGLTGEIRPVGSLTRRVREAARLGCRTVLVPSEGEFEPVSGVEVRRCRTLSEAINVVRESPGESDSDRL